MSRMIEMNRHACTFKSGGMSERVSDIAYTYIPLYLGVDRVGDDPTTPIMVYIILLLIDILAFENKL